jgi:hypothetical protein
MSMEVPGAEEEAAPEREKLRVPTWEEIAVLDAELQRRARKPALTLLRADKILGEKE